MEVLNTSESRSVEFKDHTPSLVMLHGFLHLWMSDCWCESKKGCWSGNSWERKDVIIADGDGTAKVSLWEEHIGELRNNICYNLKNYRAVVGWKEIPLHPRNSRISCITHIGDINEAHEMRKSSMSSRMYRLLLNVQIELEMNEQVILRS